MGASVPCLDGGRPAAVRESTSSPAMVLASLVAWRGAAGGRSGGRWLVRRKGAGLPPVGRWAERALATAPRRRDGRAGGRRGGGSALVVKHVLCMRMQSVSVSHSAPSVCVRVGHVHVIFFGGRVLSHMRHVGAFFVTGPLRGRASAKMLHRIYVVHAFPENLAAETPSLKNSVPHGERSDRRVKSTLKGAR